MANNVAGKQKPQSIPRKQSIKLDEHEKFKEELEELKTIRENAVKKFFHDAEVKEKSIVGIGGLSKVYHYQIIIGEEVKDIAVKFPDYKDSEGRYIQDEKAFLEELKKLNPEYFYYIGSTTATLNDENVEVLLLDVGEKIERGNLNLNDIKNICDMLDKIY